MKKKQKDDKKHLKLEEFIYRVKKELLDAQEKHKGELSFFELDNVEIEVKVATTYSGGAKGKFEFFVLNLGEVGGNIERENVHTVKLTFRVAKPQPKTKPTTKATPQQTMPENPVILGKYIFKNEKSGYTPSCDFEMPQVKPNKPFFVPLVMTDTDIAELTKQLVTEQVFVDQIIEAIKKSGEGSI